MNDEILKIAITHQLVTTGNRDGLYMQALEAFYKAAFNAGIKKAANLCDLRSCSKYYPEAQTAATCATAIRELELK